jgi:hypothetical protein
MRREPPVSRKDKLPRDLRHEPGHGPLFGWAPQATEEDLRAYRAQGSMCVCTTCVRYRKQNGIR